jgi:aspartate aminotransferase
MSVKPMALSDRMSHIGMSPTMKGTIEAERLRKAGYDVVDLGAGEPDFPTPAHIVDAAHAALTANFTKYTANMGMSELREAVGFRYREDYGVQYAADEVIMSAGGKQALFNAMMAVFNPGDEVITHAPGWPTLVEQIKLAGATPVVVRTYAEDGFALRADALLAAITPRTRGFLLNSPTNPTGAVMSDADARALGEEAARRDLWVVMDLCYERLIYEGVEHNLVRILNDAMRDRLVLAGSASKAYAMTGWRCGWTMGPKSVISACNALQSHSTSNVSSITQKAAIAALTGSQQCVADMCAEYQRRRDQLHAWLRAEEPRYEAVLPQGAFYLFPDVSQLLSPDGCRTSQAFADALLADEHVVTTSGEAFDAPGFIRLSYATSLGVLREGVTRLVRFARALDARRPGQ